MTTDEALDKIAKELQRVTAQLATVTQEKNSLQGEKETAEENRDEAIKQKEIAEEKVKEMKSLDAVQLNIQLESVNAEKIDLTTELQESKKREEELLWTNTRGLRMKGDNSPLWQMVELVLLMEKMRQSENPPSEKDDTI